MTEFLTESVEEDRTFPESSREQILLSENGRGVYRSLLENEVLLPDEILDSLVVADSKMKKFERQQEQLPRELTTTHRFRHHELLRRDESLALGMMIDMSRGAVYTTEYLKQVIGEARTMGMSFLGLYIEYFDNDQLTAAEFQELTNYATKHRIELRPYIQTLAHLEKVLCNPEYEQFKLSGSDSTLDPRQKEVYEELVFPLIDRAIECFRVSGQRLKLNIGCDETKDLSDTSVYVEHVRTVVKYCRERGVECEIWGDMLQTLLPEQLRELEDIKVVYWNYDQTIDSVIEAEILTLQEKGVHIVGTATSTHSHNQIVPFGLRSILNIDAHLQASRRCKTKELVITHWGDDGNESPLEPGLQLALYAVLRDSDLQNNSGSLTQRYLDFNQHTLLAAVLADEQGQSINPELTPLSSNYLKILFYEDPRLSTFSSLVETDNVEHFSKATAMLKNAIRTEGQYAFATDSFQVAFYDLLQHKSDIGTWARLEYQNSLAGDGIAISRMKKRINDTLCSLFNFWMLHRNVWHLEKKPEGWRTIDKRFVTITKQLITMYQDFCRLEESHQSIGYLESPPPKIKTSFPNCVRSYNGINEESSVALTI